MPNANKTMRDRTILPHTALGDDRPEGSATLDDAIWKMINVYVSNRAAIDLVRQLEVRSLLVLIPSVVDFGGAQDSSRKQHNKSRMSDNGYAEVSEFRQLMRISFYNR
jgi:hypothetical protein